MVYPIANRKHGQRAGGAAKIHTVPNDLAYGRENLLGITNGDDSICILAHYRHDSLTFSNRCATHDEFRGSPLKTVLLNADHSNLQAFCLVGYMSTENTLLKYLAWPYLLQLVDYIGDAIHHPEVRRLLARFPMGEITSCVLFNLTPPDNDVSTVRQSHGLQ